MNLFSPKISVALVKDTFQKTYNHCVQAMLGNWNDTVDNCQVVGASLAKAFDCLSYKLTNSTFMHQRTTFNGSFSSWREMFFRASSGPMFDRFYSIFTSSTYFRKSVLLLLLIMLTATWSLNQKKKHWQCYLIFTQLKKNFWGFAENQMKGNAIYAVI